MVTKLSMERMAKRGLVCSWCGVYFKREHGRFVLCKDCYKRSALFGMQGLHSLATMRELD